MLPIKFTPMFDPVSLYQTVPISPSGTHKQDSVKVRDVKVQEKVLQLLKDKFPTQSEYLFNIWATLEPAPILKKKARERGKLNSLILSKEQKGKLYDKLPLVTKKGYALYFLKPVVYEDSAGELKISFFPEQVKVNQLFEQKWIHVHRKKAQTKDGDLLLKSQGGVVLHTSKPSDTVKRRSSIPRKQKKLTPIAPLFNAKKKTTGLFDQDFDAAPKTVEKETNKSDAHTLHPFFEKILKIAQKILTFFKELWNKLFAAWDITPPPPKELGGRPNKVSEEIILSKEEQDTIIVPESSVVVISDQTTEEDTPQDDDNILDFFNS